MHRNFWAYEQASESWMICRKSMKTGIVIIAVERNQDDSKNLTMMSQTDMSLLLTKHWQSDTQRKNDHWLSLKKEKTPSLKNRPGLLEEWFRRHIDSGTINGKSQNICQWAYFDTQRDFAIWPRSIGVNEREKDLTWSKFRAGRMSRILIQHVQSFIWIGNQRPGVLKSNQIN
jgi:hypothetical protein